MTQRREIPFGRPVITDADRAAVAEVLRGPILTHGPQGEAFEREFAELLGDGAQAVALSSGMAALHLSYLHLGIGPGDEVIVPAQTHTATAHAVEWVGARPVFVDCDPGTGNLTAERIAKAVTARTRAIGLVHFVGIPCEMDGILAVAAEHDLRIVEDCAIALGTRLHGRHVGLFGDSGCFSFYPVKQITTGEGGMLVSRHPEVVEGVRRLRAFGVDRRHQERAIPGLYDVVGLGLNYRLSEIAAALGRVQLRQLPAWLERRRRSFEMLASALADLPELRILRAESAAAASSHYCLSLVLEGRLAGRRNDVVRAIKAEGVGTSVYYPQPVPRFSYYRDKYGYDEGAYPNATAISDHSIALPVGPHLGDDEMRDVAEVVRGVIGRL